MIKAVPIVDQNQIMADQNFNKNLHFLAKTNPELNYFVSIVKNGDVLIGEHAFWEAISHLEDLQNFQQKKIYILTDKSWNEIQSTYPNIVLPANVEVVSDINLILAQYQKPATKDIYLWGGVRTINNFSHYADEIILIRTKQKRNTGKNFKYAVLKTFVHKRTQKMPTFEVELYQQNQTSISIK